MNNSPSCYFADSRQALAVSITKAASKQTYYTIRYLVDRKRIDDAYLAYAYFRWLDDSLDTHTANTSQRTAFVKNQIRLLERCYRGESPSHVSIEENMLVELIRRDSDTSSGLQTYIRSMMAVMAFDAERRGRWITEHELHSYSQSLAVAVTEALHHFIGHDQPSPQTPIRYYAAHAAHIVHMLRDTHEDIANGYFNIPSEFLKASRVCPEDINSAAYRAWVKSRIGLARRYFQAGKAYLAQVKSLRCRLAGYSYIVRFEHVLNAIVHDNYQLRPSYHECQPTLASLHMRWLLYVKSLRLALRSF